MPSHNEANDSVTPPTSTVPEQTDNVVTPTDKSNNSKYFISTEPVLEVECKNNPGD